MTLEWHEMTEVDGATVREFTIHAPDRPITGVLWSGPDTKPGAPLVCFGHGASGNRHQGPIPRIASQYKPPSRSRVWTCCRKAARS